MSQHTYQRMSQLAQKFQLGDADAGNTLAEKLRSQLLVRFACAGISPTDVEDLVQNCVMDVLGSLERFDESRATIETWTAGIARNNLRNHYRKKSIQSRFEISSESAQDLSAIDSEMIDTSAAIGEAVSSLSLIDQELLRMRFSMGLSFTEIAEASNLTEANARKRVSRAVEQLRRKPEIISILV